MRVDLFYAKLSPKSRAWIDLLGALLFLLPFSVLILWTSYTFVHNAFVIRETSADPGGLPARYLLKAALPAGFLLLLLQALAHAGKALLTILGQPLQAQETKT